MTVVMNWNRVCSRKLLRGDVPKQDKIWITNRRQQQAAKNALAALQQAREIFENSDGEEFLAVDLRSCLNDPW